MEKYRNKTIVFFGDSITDSAKSFNANHPYGAGYVNMLRTEIDVYYPELNIKIYNEGIGGNKTENLLERFNEDVASKNPDLVFLFIGINDVWHPYENGGMPNYDDILGRMTLLINKIKNLGSEVVLLTPFLFPADPFYDFFTELKPHFEAYYSLYKEYLNNNKLNYIDIYEILKPYSIVANNHLTKDSVHPEIIGHGIIAQAVLDYLKNH